MIREELIASKAAQHYYEIKPKNKVEVMSRLPDMYVPKFPTMSYNTKCQVDDLVQELQGRGCFAEGLHGGLRQVQRDRVMDSFRNGHTDILVAADMTTRDTDVGDVEVVFNYDTPQDDGYCVHRIGRTSKVGKKGKTFSLVMDKEVYKLGDIQRYCKTKTIPQAIPSLNDIMGIKVEKILGRVQEALNDTDLTKTVNIIEKKFMEEDYTSMDLATVPLKTSMGDENEDIIDSSETARSLNELDNFGQGNSRDRGRECSPYGNRRKGATDRVAVDYVLGEGEEKMARLFINIDKAQRITSGDILGTVAGKSGIPGRMVRSIDMYDGHTSMDVPGRYADDVLKAMAHTRIKRKNIHVEEVNTSRR